MFIYQFSKFLSVLSVFSLPYPTYLSLWFVPHLMAMTRKSSVSHRIPKEGQSSHSQMFCRKSFLKISTISHERTSIRVFFTSIIADLVLLKKCSITVLCSEICNIFQNICENIIFTHSVKYSGMQSLSSSVCSLCIYELLH